MDFFILRFYCKLVTFVFFPSVSERNLCELDYACVYFKYLTIYDTFGFVSMQFILPYLIGWHAFANSIKPEDSGRANIASSRYGGDFEWSRKWMLQSLMEMVEMKCHVVSVPSFVGIILLLYKWIWEIGCTAYLLDGGLKWPWISKRVQLSYAKLKCNLTTGMIRIFVKRLDIVFFKKKN